ncbi:hypothetical protein DUI87_25115 [Hirundo rustica rustica]|uniref:Rho-GAP domain-containing protein n=1 Tax=Hirundo rustica rustica TaxID=333673 RepID=A0A3M0JBA0_HIRRU|nr:hypothetical protein DUI87_25115 [Hirundo rustica rustica]
MWNLCHLSLGVSQVERGQGGVYSVRALLGKIREELQESGQFQSHESSCVWSTLESGKLISITSLLLLLPVGWKGPWSLGGDAAVKTIVPKEEPGSPGAALVLLPEDTAEPLRGGSFQSPYSDLNGIFSLGLLLLFGPFQVVLGRWHGWHQAEVAPGWRQPEDLWLSPRARPSPGMQPTALQSLSELERASLQELALFRLQERLPGGHLTLDRDGSKGIKSIRQKLESFSKERKDCSPHTFGVPLSQVIANDRACRQLQEAVGRSRRLCLEVEATVTRFRAQRQKRLGMGTSCIRAPEGEEPLSPALLDKSSWSQRRGAMSVDSITDLSDNASKLLEALQLSHPHELDPRRSRGKKKTLSLNPITWQVPRIVDRCCTHLETHGLQTVGIFRVGSSKKRVQQLREEFDRGLDVFLDEHQSVHDVAALLKEFLRDMPDPLIPRELYGAFLSTASEYLGSRA